MEEVDLSVRENWTSQMKFIHTKALVIGLVLGHVLGCIETAIMILMARIIYQ